MLYLVSYEHADPCQDQRIRETLATLNGKQLLRNTWILEDFKKTTLDILWAIRLGENLRILVVDVSHSHFATAPYSDVRGLLRRPVPEKPAAD